MSITSMGTNAALAHDEDRAAGHAGGTLISTPSHCNLMARL